ncbi:MAG TPA: glycosyltransferase family 4 protein, partial [Candidatus Tectomicrobia bacterium]
MKIALFHLGFFYSGGGEKLVLEEMRGLRERGHDVDCYAPFVDVKSCFPDYPEMAQVKPLLPEPPGWLPMRDPLWVMLSCILIPLMAWRFRGYDVFLGANQPGPWLAYVLAKLLKKPYIAYLAQPLRLLHPRAIDEQNGLRIREGDHKFLMILRKLAGSSIDWADRSSVCGAAAVLTNGSYVASWIQRVYGVDVIDCPAGCHVDDHESLDYSKRWSGHIGVNGWQIPKPYILLTNRHSPMKRFEYALWALKTILRSNPSVTLVITGQKTSYTRQLEYLADSLGIENSVRFVGLISEDSLRRLYRQAAGYVYPSPEEDFGMGIVEAMAAGTPTVAWDCCGPTVTVESGVTGYLVEPYDTEAFARRMLGLLTNPGISERLGRSGNERARKLFSYARHVSVLED